MRMYLKNNVWDEALKRIEWLFDEFPNIICNVSGGKDSTVIFHLCLQVARAKGRLPLKVRWLDQEAEWQATVDQIKPLMYHPDVEAQWYQMPFKLFNAASSIDHWLHCWDPNEKEKWIHPQDPISIKENIFNCDRFIALFKAIGEVNYPDTPTATLTGVRVEESPGRMKGLTYYKTYKWATWGSIEDKSRRHYIFHPIYDWSYTDVWKAILDNGWEYNAIYDAQYQYGVPIPQMRVSNVHHETAVHSLFYLQELEPETYERLAQRIGGIDMAGKLGKADYWIKELPSMFNDWREYRDYLLLHLVDNPEWRAAMAKVWDYHDRIIGEDMGKMKYQVHISQILTHDWEDVKGYNFITGPSVISIIESRRIRRLPTRKRIADYGSTK